MLSLTQRPFLVSAWPSADLSHRFEFDFHFPLNFGLQTTAWFFSLLRSAYTFECETWFFGRCTLTHAFAKCDSTKTRMMMMNHIQVLFIDMFVLFDMLFVWVCLLGRRGSSPTLRFSALLLTFHAFRRIEFFYTPESWFFTCLVLLELYLCLHW